MSGRGRAYVWLTAFFLLGGVGGGAIGRVYTQHEMSEALFAGEPQARDKLFSKGLAAQLDLSAAEQQRVDEILERYKAKRRDLMNQLFDKCGAPMDELQRQMDDEMAAALKPEQATSWRAFTERRRRERFGSAGTPAGSK